MLHQTVTLQERGEFMSSARPTGMLMTGAVGSIFFTIAWLIMIGSFAYVLGMVLGGGAPSAGTSEGLGGLMLLSIVLMLAGGITQGIGFFGLKQLFGSMNSLAGLFAILVMLGQRKDDKTAPASQADSAG
jgi:hypothetical protein